MISTYHAEVLRRVWLQECGIRRQARPFHHLAPVPPQPGRQAKMAGQPQQDQQERGALGALQGCHYLLSSLQAVMFPLDQIGKTTLLALDTSDKAKRFYPQNIRYPNSMVLFQNY